MQDDSSGPASRSVVETRHHCRETRAVDNSEWQSVPRIADRNAPEGPRSSLPTRLRPVVTGNDARWHSLRGERIEICIARTPGGLCPTNEEHPGQSCIHCPTAPEVQKALRLRKSGWVVHEEQGTPVYSQVAPIHEGRKNGLKVGAVVPFFAKASDSFAQSVSGSVLHAIFPTRSGLPTQGRTESRVSLTSSTSSNGRSSSRRPSPNQ